VIKFLIASTIQRHLFSHWDHSSNFLVICTYVNQLYILNTLFLSRRMLSALSNLSNGLVPAAKKHLQFYQRISLKRCQYLPRLPNLKAPFIFKVCKKSNCGNVVVFLTLVVQFVRYVCRNAFFWNESCTLRSNSILAIPFSIIGL
jgi:hypothetical protein